MNIIRINRQLLDNKDTDRVYIKNVDNRVIFKQFFQTSNFIFTNIIILLSYF